MAVEEDMDRMEPEVAEETGETEESLIAERTAKMEEKVVTQPEEVLAVLAEKKVVLWTNTPMDPKGPQEEEEAVFVS